MKKIPAAILTALSLLVIIVVAMLMVLYPQTVLSAFALDEQRAFFPLMFGAALLGGGAAGLLSWGIMTWIWRAMRGFRHLSHNNQATVTVEFLLVLPILCCMFATLFSLAEIAHAQLTFRYAAFSAARAGAVADYLLRPLPNSKLEFYQLSNQDKDRMTAAAVVALAGLDPTKRDKPAPPIKVENFNLTALSKTFNQVNNDFWHTPDFFQEHANAITPSLSAQNFHCAYSPLFNDNIADFLVKLIHEAIISKIEDPDSGGGIVTQFLGQIIKPLLEKILPIGKEFINELLKALGIMQILQMVPNPLSPPIVQVQMTFRPTVRSISLFSLFDVALTRTTDVKTITPLSMQTSGGKTEFPTALIMMFTDDASFFPGASQYKKIVDK